MLAEFPSSFSLNIMNMYVFLVIYENQVDFATFLDPTIGDHVRSHQVATKLITKGPKTIPFLKTYSSV